MGVDISVFAGTSPPSAPWGTEDVRCSPDLERRLAPIEPKRPEVCVVFGAGGALGPDVVHGLLRRVAVVIGVDQHITYRVDGAIYRDVNLNEPEEVLSFFHEVRQTAARQGLRMGPCYDLATIQTSATDGSDRDALVEGKRAILDALCESESDATLVYMSTAEVYGAPEGAPYLEEHVQEPVNVYGRHKRAEERAMLEAHGRPTLGGNLHVTALRTWTISMVNYDETGKVIGTRNYNDPMISLAEKLARSGVRLPVPEPEMQAQFHRSEEVAEVLVHLGEQVLTAASWGRAFNCIGQPTTHGAMRDICVEVFGMDEDSGSGVAASVANAMEPVLAKGIGLGARWAHQMKWLGATRFGERLPFLYRSTHIDGGALKAVLGDALAEPDGTTSEEAVRVLCEGLLRGGPDALNMRRYAMY